MKKYTIPTIEMLTVSTVDILLSSAEDQPIINGLDNLTLDDF